jgi:hypothetical protein
VVPLVTLEDTDVDGIPDASIDNLLQVKEEPMEELPPDAFEEDEPFDLAAIPLPPPPRPEDYDVSTEEGRRAFIMASIKAEPVDPDAPEPASSFDPSVPVDEDEVMMLPQ